MFIRVNVLLFEICVVSFKFKSQHQILKAVVRMYQESKNYSLIPEKNRREECSIGKKYLSPNTSNQEIKE